MTTQAPKSADTTPDWRRLGRVVGLLALLLVVGLFVAVAIPQVVGAEHSYVVQSDSMSPAIDAGAVVFVQAVQTNEISEGDVLTYQRAGADYRVTHRVVDVVSVDGERRFRTQGDANEEPDPTLVAPDSVVGVVGFSVPLIGHVVAFATSPLGLVALVVVPAIALAVTEVWALLAAGSDDEGGSNDADGRGDGGGSDAGGGGDGGGSDAGGGAEKP